jgi:uncharacterized phage protein gp47/JayE
MAFQREFDELLNAILTDWRNQFPEADTSQGSLVFLRSACLASALWGLYHHQEWISRQIFPDTADTAMLEHHAWRKGLTRLPDETDEQLLSRLLAVLRNPPAGGNRFDYEMWAREIADVAQAWCLPLRRGPGTVDIVILADIATGSEIPAQGLLDAVLANVEAKRPVGMAAVDPVVVLAPTVVTQAVTMGVSGEVDTAQLTADITAYLNQLIPGQSLYRAQLIGLAVQSGAVDVDLTVPAATVAVQLTELIRAGVISVA